MLSIVFSAHFKSDSPLTKLMRTMSADMKKARVEIIAGKKISNFGKNYTKINSAKPSSESKKGDQFKEFASTFLVQMDRFKNASSESAKMEFNALAKTCVHCHETYCPGPITMLRKLQIP
jgi:cytochrome c556